MRRAVTRALVAGVLLGLVGCVGSAQPRRPTPPPRRGVATDQEPLLLGSEPRQRRADDPFAVPLPRSGDPAHPNVRVALRVLDVARRRDLWVSGRVRGSIVRGVVNLRAAVSAGSRSGAARSDVTTFLVVQAPGRATLQVSSTFRNFGLPYAALDVTVLAAGPDGVELALNPATTAPTTRRGEQVALGTQVSLAPGQAVVVGGIREERAAARRSGLSYGESTGERELLAVLVAEVIR